MKNFYKYLFIALIPAIIALAHDAFLFYEQYELDFGKAFADAEQKGPLSFFAALGYIWTRYHPESYKWVIESTGGDVWAAIDSFLTIKAFFLGLVIALAVLLGMLICRFSSLKRPGHKKSKKFDRESRGSRTEYKYKRKR